MKTKPYIIKSDKKLYAINCMIAIDKANLMRNGSVYAAKYKATWDTGASVTCISKRIVNDLQLIPIDESTIMFTANGITKSQIYKIDIMLPNGFIISNISSILQKSNPTCDVLIGMDIITQGDLTIRRIGSGTEFIFTI